jgi:hypothetical protein
MGVKAFAMNGQLGEQNNLFNCYDQKVLDTLDFLPK